MPEILIFSTTTCPYCVRAKRLLERKQVAFTEVNLDKEPDRRDEMLTRSNGRKTVPQIFIGERHIGGCDDLHALDAAGELDPLLAPV
ncbi:MAG: glutaredoxin 3 [Magnetococcales bacterium]|nr:glutaredoxin 3 [Magnetococcales bacterium]